MQTNISKTKNNSGKDYLQKELDFYTNLLAQHEKNVEKKNNVPRASCSNISIQKSYSIHSKLPSKPNEMFTLKRSKSDLRTVKEDQNMRKNYVHSYQKRPSIQSSKTAYFVPMSNSLTSSKIFIKHNVKEPVFFTKSTDNSKVIGSNYCKYNSTMHDMKNFSVCNKEASNKLLINKKVSSKSDSKALIGEIAAVTEKLKIKSGQNDAYKKLLDSQAISKRVNSLKVEKKKDFHIQNIKQSITKNNISLSLSEVKVPASSTNTKVDITTSKLLFAGNGARSQKSNSNMHINLLEKLDAVEKLLNATAKNSSEAFKKVEKSCPKSKVHLNNNCHQAVVKSFKLTGSSHKPQFVHLSRTSSAVNSKFLQKQKFHSNKNVSLRNSSFRKSLRLDRLNEKPKHAFLPPANKNWQLHKASNLVKTRYKVINKGNQQRRLATGFMSSNAVLNSINRNNKSDVQKNSYRLVNNHKANSKLAKVPKSSSKRKFVKGVYLSNYSPTRNIFSLLKKTPNKVSKKYSSIAYRSVFKHKQNSALNISYKLSESSLENVTKSDIDVDLLLELAAEKKNMISKSGAGKMRYKSKNKVINSYSVQARTAKMIKTKYFNPCKKFAYLKNVNKSFKGYRSNYETSILKNSKSYSHKLKSRKYPQKKIVNLGGEKFIIGSTGRTLKKLHIQSTKIAPHKQFFKGKAVIKTPSPVSKMIANRALNRSINLALSAWTKKKMQKVNTYCMFYNRFGRCNKGIKCAFVHDPSKIAVCTRFLRGTCKSENCLFSHEINPGKMAICSFFLQDACTKADCPYLHEKLSSDAELCKSFVQGYCPNGKYCKKAHILICSKFLRGQCDKGKDCVFPHPTKKEKIVNPKSSDDNQMKDEFQLETVLRYFESNPKESLTKGLVVPSRMKSLPKEQDFISLTMDKTS